MELFLLSGGSMSYLALVAVTLVIGLGATAHVHRQLNRFSRVPSNTRLTGAQMAERMLSAHGVGGVVIRRGAPEQNHFDPRDNSITLDPQAYGGTSITSIATACHEVGHAIQFAQGYSPMKIRSSIVPVVNLASNLWIVLLIAGIFLQMAQLTMLAIIMYAAVVVFQLVTLPVEFNASARAMAYLSSQPMISGEERSGASKVLRACALTYVAAALTSLLQLLWLLGQNRDE